MATLRIEGGRRLSGRLAVEGNKNSALPLMAACLLTDEECVLTNVPRIRDVAVLAELLTGLGATVDGVGTPSLRIHCPSVTSDEPDAALVGKLRGSVLLLGPLLARRGSARLAQPGGDFPARRTIGTHLAGADRPRRRAARRAGPRPRSAERPARRVVLSGRGVGHRHRDRAARGCRGARADRDPPRGDGAARRRAVRFLRAMGASIDGEGTSTIRVAGAGAAARRAAPARRRLHRGRQLGRRRRDHRRRHRGHRRARRATWRSIAAPLRKMGLRCVTDDDRFVVEHSPLTAVRRITTGLWPGFPSDMISLVTVLATQADGRTLVHDWMYELRLFALEQLSAMQRRSVPLRSAPDHRQRSDAAARPRARQPRHAIRHGADRRRAGRGRREPVVAARDRRARLRRRWSSGCRCSARRWRRWTR